MAIPEDDDRDGEGRPPRRWGRILFFASAGFVLLVVVAAAIYFVVSRDPQQALRKSLQQAAQFANRNKHREAIAIYKKALLLAPDNENIHRAIAASYLKLGEGAKAITEYKNYLQRKPDDRRGQLVLAGLYLRSGNVYEAKRITDSILQLNPEDITALVLRAECYRRNKQPKLEAEDLQKIIRLAPGWSPAYIAMAELQIGDRDPLEAEQYLRKAVAASPGDLQPVVRLAQFYAAHKRLAEAESVLLNAVQENPNDEGMRRAYAEFLILVRRFDESLAQYRQVLSLDETNVAALMGSVAANLFRNDLSSARTFSGKLLNTKGGRLSGLYYRGLVNLLEEKADRAIKDLLQVAEEYPDNAGVQYLLGIAYIRTNDVEGAKARLGRALQIAPTFVTAQLVLAEVLMATGDATEAVAEAEEVLKRQADNLQALLIAGQSYLLQKAPQKAEPYLERSVEIDKESVFARMVLARVYRETGKEAEAVQAYREIIELNPDLAIARFLLGTLYYDMGDYEKAIEQYERAVQIDPNFPAGVNNLAYAYAEHGGDLDEAQRLIEPIAAEFPGQASIQDTLAWVLFKKGMYAEALKMLKAIPPEKREERVLIGYHYALALYKNDKKSEARAEFEKVLPKIEDEAKRREILEILKESGTKT